MTIGGNDIGFEHIIQACMKATLVPNNAVTPCLNEKAGAYERLEALESDLTNLLQQIHLKAPNATIAIGSYPDLLAQSGVCVGVSVRALPWLQQFAADLASTGLLHE